MFGYTVTPVTPKNIGSYIYKKKYGKLDFFCIARKGHKKRCNLCNRGFKDAEKPYSIRVLTVTQIIKKSVTEV